MRKNQLMEKVSNCELRLEFIGNGYATWHMYSNSTGHHSVTEEITIEQMDACLTADGRYDTKLMPRSKRVKEHWDGFISNQ